MLSQLAQDYIKTAQIECNRFGIVLIMLRRHEELRGKRFRNKISNIFEDCFIAYARLMRDNLLEFCSADSC